MQTTPLSRVNEVIKWIQRFIYGQPSTVVSPIRCRSVLALTVLQSASYTGQGYEFFSAFKCTYFQLIPSYMRK